MPTADAIAAAAAGNVSPATPGLTQAAAGGNLGPATPGSAAPAAGVQAILNVSDTGGISPPTYCRFVARQVGTAGNSITVRTVGTADGSPTGPYPATTITVGVVGSAVTINWQPTQNGLYPSEVAAALAANPTAANLVYLETFFNVTAAPWPTVATALTGGTGTAVTPAAAAVVAAAGGNLSPTAPGAIA
jgi:hypothetical protein